jgi:CRP-like cAMP-binding protein
MDQFPIRVKTFQESALRWARIQEFFRDCSDEQVTSFLAHGRWSVKPAGTFFFREGDQLDTFYILHTGRLSAYQLTTDGQQALLKYIRPGEPFGLASILPFSRTLASAQAVVESAALAWHRDTVKPIIKSSPQLAFNLAGILARSYEEVLERYVWHATRPVQARIAWALVKLADEIGKQEGDQIVIAEGFNQKDLAGLAGTTIYSVSRILSQWQRKKILEKRRGRMVIPDIYRLKATLKSSTRKQ